MLKKHVYTFIFVTAYIFNLSTYLLFHSFHPVCVALISRHNEIREECLAANYFSL